MTDKTPPSPDVLDAEADDLEVRACVAEFEPSRLRSEASRRRVLANLLRRRDDAAAELAVAEIAVAQRTGEYEATGPAEADASARAVEARLLFESARDAAAEAQASGAAPAAQVEALMRAEASALVDEHEQGALAAVQADRQDAYGRLNGARERVRVAKAAVAAADRAVDDPGQVEPDAETEMRNLAFSWPVRLLLAKLAGPEYKLTPVQSDVCAAYAGFFAEAAGVGASTVRRQAQAEARAAINAELARIALVAKDGREINVSRALGRL